MVPRVKEPVAWVEVDGEVVIYDEATTSMHLLNNAATAVWMRCDGRASLAEIISDLAETYQADEGQIARDVTDLVGQLGSKGLLDGVTVDAVTVDGVTVDGVTEEGVASDGE